MQIKVQIKSVYGTERIYPVCEAAKTFAALTGKVTLDREDILLIRSLGYEIAVVVERQLQLV